LKNLKYTYLTCLIAILLSCNANKKLKKNTPPPITNAGEITYDIKLDLIEAAEGMEEVFGKTAKVKFNQKYLRLQKVSDVPNEEFQMVALASGTEYNYLDFRGKKYMIQTPMESVPSIGAFTYHDTGGKTIAGIPCKRATATMGDGQMEVFYTDAIDVKWVPYTMIEGFALQYTLNMPYGQVTYTANQVELKTVTGLDNLPQGYKAVTAEELQKEFMGEAAISVEGTKVMDFSKFDMLGNLHSLSNYKDKVVVLNFWFTACKPCEIEMPHLNELKAELAGQSVVFFGVTYDEAPTVAKFLEKTPFNFTIIPDAHDLIKAYDIFAYPTTLVFDKSGQMIDMKIGGSSTIKEELKKRILEAL